MKYLTPLIITILVVLGSAPAPAHAQTQSQAPSSIGPPADDVDTSAAEPESFAPATMNPLAALDQVGNAIQQRGGGTGAMPSAGQPASGGLSTAINIMLVLTVVSLAPSIILMTTCFTRVIIVLGMLKQAMGTSTVPPPQVITALALFVTLIVMAPTIERIHTEAIVPYRQGTVTDYDELWERAKQPIRDFMFTQIDSSNNWSSVYMILSRRGVDISEPEKLTRADVDMLTLVPAYMLSELKVAFLIGFKIYLPFLVIDMVISTMLISMGMMMLPPVMVSLPFKLLLFVLVDGWTLLVGGLMRSVTMVGS